ncbi:MAG: MBL fold metallo-hydrolase [Alphaproteobacteria bacterium]|nr:MBL fold metallo-hydrolase [Alphaproteobacteria bacterium]MDP6813707.1 MBL fold metallo-hydrolase [Alphaproteobacteria bacterium]
MQYRIVPVTPFRQNCSLLWCPDSGRAAVVDPGGDLDRILAAADDAGVEIERILLTHGHVDHAGGAGELADRLAVPIEGPHVEDQFLLDRMAKQAERTGLAGARPVSPDRWLSEGDQVGFGEVSLSVLHCPGHTPGHLVFHHAPSKLAVVGDVLFRGSVGRCDGPKGDHMELINSIRGKLWPLGDDTAFIPGHGDMSTFAFERAANAFVSDFVEY